MRRRLLGRGVACAALMLLAPGAWSAAQGAGANAGLERSVKAAFLYKFLGYTEFPESAFSEPGAPVTIGVLGADDLAAELARVVAGRTIGNRPIVVKTVREGDPTAPLHMLFIGGADNARVGRVLKSLQGAQPGPWLVVSEAEQGLQQGSVINFRLVGERVRFDVSLEAADRNKVKLSSRLLTVANHVHKGAP